MPYILFFLRVLWYTLGAVVICGLCVSLCRTLFVHMLGGGAGRAVVMATSIIGTPVHELGHALMCLLFGHRIIAMSLWQPRATDGNLGFVTHRYNPRHPYQVLGNLFIGIGPVFSGLGVLTLVLWLCFPATLADYVAAMRATGVGDGGQGSRSLFFEGLKMLPHIVDELIGDGRVPLWGRVVGLLVLLSVSLHIDLSPDDIKGSLRAIPLYMVLVLILTVVCALLGEGVMAAVMGGLARFSALMTALFTVVLVAALVQLVLALPIWLLRRSVS